MVRGLGKDPLAGAEEALASPGPADLQRRFLDRDGGSLKDSSVLRCCSVLKGCSGSWVDKTGPREMFKVTEESYKSLRYDYDIPRSFKL